MFQEITGSLNIIQSCDCSEKCTTYCATACTYCGGEFPRFEVRMVERADINSSISAEAEV